MGFLNCPRTMWIFLLLALGVVGHVSIANQEEAEGGASSRAVNNNVDDRFNVIEQQLSLLRADARAGCPCQRASKVNSYFRHKQLQPTTRMMIRLRRYQFLKKQQQEKKEQERKEEVKPSLCPSAALLC